MKESINKNTCLLFFAVLLFPAFSFAQKAKTQKQGNKWEKFDYSEWRRTFNRSFANILNGVGPNNLIGNYASLDPVDGEFNFKGTTRIGKVDSRVSFLSLALQGEIASDNISKLFENSKINTNTAIKGEFHYMLGVRRITRETEREALFKLQEAVIKKKKDIAFANSAAESTKNQEKLKLIKDEKAVINLQKTKQEATVRQARKKVDSLKALPRINTGKPAYVDTLGKYVTKLSKALTRLDSLNILLDKKILNEDSLTNALANWSDLVRGKRNEINKTLGRELDSLKDNYLFSSYQLAWLTVIGSVGKKNYYSFDGKLPFNQQITKNELLTNSIGLALNIYNRNETFTRSWLLNIGVLQSLDNNAYLKTTTDVSQEMIFKNAAGDTTRKATQKYSAYTEPITSTKIFSAYANFYYLSGRNFIGIHVFPSYYKATETKGYANFGVGYIASFKNVKKDGPLVNLEVYAQLNDLFDSLDVGSKFYDRNEIGVRLTFPFNFFN